MGVKRHSSLIGYLEDLFILGQPNLGMTSLKEKATINDKAAGSVRAA